MSSHSQRGGRGSYRGTRSRATLLAPDIPVATHSSATTTNPPTTVTNSNPLPSTRPPTTTTNSPPISSIPFHVTTNSPTTTTPLTTMPNPPTMNTTQVIPDISPRAVHPNVHEVDAQGPPKNTRGATKRTIDIIRKEGEPKVRAEFWDGRPITRAFITTVGVWIRTPTTLPYTVRTYDEIEAKYRRKLYERIRDNFELLELKEAPPGYIPPKQRPSQYVPIYVPPGESDPLEVLPVSLGVRRMIETWCRTRYKDWRSRMCTDYFDVSESFEEKLKNRPDVMDPDSWLYLCTYWSTPEYQALRRGMKEARAKNDMTYTGGSESYAHKRKREVDTTGQPVNEIALFDATHTKKTGTFVSTRCAEVSAKMHEMQREHTQDDGRCSLDSQHILQSVIGKGKKGNLYNHGKVLIPPQPSVTQDDIQQMIDERVEARIQAVFGAIRSHIPAHVWNTISQSTTRAQDEDAEDSNHP